MNVGFVGMGKLGLPVALAVESKGHEVVGYDVNPAVAGYIAEKRIPYTEEGLQPLLDTTNIQMAESIGEVVAKSDLVFLPIQTPHDPKYEGTTRIPEDRSDFDYTWLKEGILTVSNEAQRLGRNVTLAVISTCLPGTFSREIEQLLNGYVDYVYTPQFIAMGTVLNDYLHPEFNLIGVHSTDAARKLEDFYSTINDAPCVVTDITTAEGIKVSYNTWITAKTVIANAWGELAHKTGMNFDDILKAWKLSHKRLISDKYMDSGVGDGGGCHPRDNIAMSYIADKVTMSHNLWEDLMAARQDHMDWLARETIAASTETELPAIILGRSFKPETNIETGSPAILMANLIANEYGYPVECVEDSTLESPAVYTIGTKHSRYATYSFPKGSVVIDPFRYIPAQEGVKIVRIGGKI